MAKNSSRGIAAFCLVMASSSIAFAQADAGDPAEVSTASPEALDAFAEPYTLTMRTVAEGYATAIDYVPEQDVTPTIRAGWEEHGIKPANVTFTDKEIRLGPLQQVNFASEEDPEVSCLRVAQLASTSKRKQAHAELVMAKLLGAVPDFPLAADCKLIIPDDARYDSRDPLRRIHARLFPQSQATCDDFLPTGPAPIDFAPLVPVATQIHHSGERVGQDNGRLLSLFQRTLHSRIMRRYPKDQMDPQFMRYDHRVERDDRVTMALYLLDEPATDQFCVVLKVTQADQEWIGKKMGAKVGRPAFWLTRNMSEAWLGQDEVTALADQFAAMALPG